MAIDPSISLGVRPPQIALPQFPSPLDRYQKMLTLRHLMDQQQYQQLQRQQALEAQQREQAFMEYWRNPQPETPAGVPAPAAPAPATPYIGSGTGGAPYTPMAPPAGPATGTEGFFPAVPPPPAAPRLPSTAQTLGMLGTKGIPVVKAFAELETERRKADVERLKAERDKWDAFGSLAGTVKDEKSKNTAIGLGLSRGLLTPEQARTLFAQPYDAGQYDQFRLSAIAAKDQAEDALKRAELPGKEADVFQKKAEMYSSKLAVAAARGPEALAAARSELPADFQEFFRDAVTPKQIREKALTAPQYLTAHQQKSQAASQLRQDWLMIAKPFQMTVDSYANIQAVRGSDAPVADSIIVRQLMKLLEPTSAVLGAEQQDIAMRTGLGDWLSNLWKNVQTGQRLTPDQRSQILKAADDIYGYRSKLYSARAEDYRGMARDQEINPDNVVNQFEKGLIAGPPAAPKPQSLVEGVVNRANAPAVTASPKDSTTKPYPGAPPIGQIEYDANGVPHKYIGGNHRDQSNWPVVQQAK